MPPSINADPEQLLERLADAAPSRVTVEGLLGTIAARIGAPAPSFDQEGLLSLTIADEVSMTLVHGDGLPGVIAAAEMPETLTSNSDLLADLLTANLDWRRVGGATFGKLPGDGPVVLCRLLPITSDEGADETASKRLEQDLLDFATVAADWIDDLETSLDLDIGPTAEALSTRGPSTPPGGFV